MQDTGGAKGILNILINVVFPTLILTKTEDYLGVKEALVIALSLPLGYGAYDLITEKKFNILSILGFVSVLLTGAIGLLELDASMIAVKEALIPLLIGISILILKKTKYSLSQSLLPKVLDFEKIESSLKDDESKQSFAKLIDYFNYFMAFTFLVSATLNFILAKMIVKADAGTVEFNKQIGEMTALSFPVIALPTTILLIGFIIYLTRRLSRITSLALEEMLITPPK